MVFVSLCDNNLLSILMEVKVYLLGILWKRKFTSKKSFLWEDEKVLKYLSRSKKNKNHNQNSFRVATLHERVVYFHETFICLRHSPGSCRKHVEFLLFTGVPLSLILSKSFAFFGVEKKLGLIQPSHQYASEEQQGWFLYKSPNDFRVANLDRGKTA